MKDVEYKIQFHLLSCKIVMTKSSSFIKCLLVHSFAKTRYSYYSQSRLLSLSFFKAGDSSINKDADTVQIRQAGVSVYQRVEAWHGDSDTGGSLSSSLRIGGSNDDAH